ncbi:MAG TPA: hypothetical protein VHC63_03550 [Acidimicrobiales bacterium]|nr:hypothetical protein [Acidimicrobiales bacterium]
MQDLRLPRTARRVTGWTNAILLAGLAMAGIVFADNNQWGRCSIAYAVWALCVYLLGTAAYRVSLREDGRIEAHSLLGLRKVDLRNGFSVKNGLGVRVLRAGGKRFRLNPGLGRRARIEEWFQAAQRGSTVSGNG